MQLLNHHHNHHRCTAGVINTGCAESSIFGSMKKASTPSITSTSLCCASVFWNIISRIYHARAIITTKPPSSLDYLHKLTYLPRYQRIEWLRCKNVLQIDWERNAIVAMELMWVAYTLRLGGGNPGNTISANLMIFNHIDHKANTINLLHCMAWHWTYIWGHISTWNYTDNLLSFCLDFTGQDSSDRSCALGR